MEDADSPDGQKIDFSYLGCHLITQLFKVVQRQSESGWKHFLITGLAARWRFLTHHTWILSNPWDWPAGLQVEPHSTTEVLWSNWSYRTNGCGGGQFSAVASRKWHLCLRGLDKNHQINHKLHPCVWKENKREIHQSPHLKEEYEKLVKPQGELLSVTRLNHKLFLLV